MTATVSIYTVERSNVLTIPSAAMRYIPDVATLRGMGISVKDANKEAPQGRKLIWQRTGNTIEPKIISTGVSYLGNIEVTNGMTDGEEVITDLTDKGEDRS
jgi:HlyD family secretion protein